MKDYERYIDFIIDVEAGSEVRVLQLTDTQIIDASQRRYESRLNEKERAFWAKENMEERVFRHIREAVARAKPHLIILSGSSSYILYATARSTESCPSCGETTLNYTTYSETQHYVECDDCGYTWRSGHSFTRERLVLDKAVDEHGFAALFHLIALALPRIRRVLHTVGRRKEDRVAVLGAEDRDIRRLHEDFSALIGPVVEVETVDRQNAHLVARSRHGHDLIAVTIPWI